MTKVLFVYERMMPTIELLKEKYSRLQQCCVSFVELKSVTNKLIDESDVLILIRPSDPLSLAIAKKAGEAGALVIFYTDDDLINLPGSVPFSRSRRKHMRKIVESSELVLAANRHICEKYSKMMPKPRYACTITSVDYLDLECIEAKLEEDNKDCVRMVYAAGNGHEPVFCKYIRPVLAKIFEKYRDRLSLDFVGVHPEVDVNGKIQYIAGMSLDEYRAFMSKQHYDIGLAPLEATEFGKGKHYNKYLEYTSAGVVGVYSDCEPFTYAVKDRYNGILSSNDTESWFEAISFAIDHPELRKECLRNARDQIRTEFTAEAFEAKLYRDVPELLGRDTERKPSRSLLGAKLRYRVFSLIDKGYLFFFYLRTNRGYILKKLKGNKK